MKGKAIGYFGISLCCAASAVCMQGCASSGDSGKTQIEIVQYKPEAAGYFDALEEKFNAEHDDIQLKISSPNDAMTILRTRFIREDYPDIIGIGGDINYSYFVDAEILADVSDYPGLQNIKQAYRDIDEALELVPTDGSYAVPYVANAAGVLYNRDMFAEHGWGDPAELVGVHRAVRRDPVGGDPAVLFRVQGHMDMSRTVERDGGQPRTG